MKEAQAHWLKLRPWNCSRWSLLTDRRKNMPVSMILKKPSVRGLVMAADSWCKVWTGLRTSSKYTKLPSNDHRAAYHDLLLMEKKGLLIPKSERTPEYHRSLGASFLLSLRRWNVVEKDLIKVGLLTDEGMVSGFLRSQLSPSAERMRRHRARHSDVTCDGQKREERRKKKDKSKKEDFAVPAQSVLDYLNKRTGRSFKNTKDIEARLKEGYSVEDGLTVVKCKCAQWLDDDKMRMFLKPATLFRKQNFPKYLDEGQAGMFHEMKEIPHLKPNWEVINGSE